MDLRYSVTGIPVIEIDDHTSIAFCNPGGSEVGYKYFIVKVMVTEFLKKGRMSNGERQAHKSVTLERNFISRVNFTDLDSSIKNKKPLRALIPKLKKLLNKYIVDELFPFDKLKAFERDLKHLDTAIYEEKEKKLHKDNLKAERAAKKAAREQKKADLERIKQEKLAKKEAKKELVLQKKVDREKKKILRELKAKERLAKKKVKKENK